MNKHISELNDRVIWEQLTSGKTAEDIKYGLPKEFWGYVDDTANDLLNQRGDLIFRAKSTFRNIYNTLDACRGSGRWERQEFAEMAKDSPFSDLVLQLLDNRDISPVVWMKIKPAADGGVFKRNEDVS